MAPRGVYRERNGLGNGQNSVVVDYGTSHFEKGKDHDEAQHGWLQSALLVSSHAEKRAIGLGESCRSFVSRCHNVAMTLVDDRETSEN
jgi:hypothetical protein